LKVSGKELAIDDDAVLVELRPGEIVTIRLAIQKH
jgi:hypothetical protein